MLAVALDAASGHHASRITTIDLVIGELGNIVDDSIQFYFDPLSRRHDLGWRVSAGRCGRV